jgi:hypothetical protein
MSRRTAYTLSFTALGIVLLLVGVWLALVMPTRCPVTEAASERIKPGMTRAEVEAILGGPPGEYRTRIYPEPDEYLPSSGWVSDGFRGWKAGEWQGDEGKVSIYFDSSDSVFTTRFNPVVPRNAGTFAFVVARLRYLLRGWLP